MKNKLIKILLIFMLIVFFTTCSSIKINESYAASGSYYIKVNCETNVVTIYEMDSNGNAGNPIKAMLCSCGSATPSSGVYKLNYKYRWLALYGNVYGQYCSRIVGNILFHSVPYLREGDHNSLEFWEYDKLGTSASAGCIRLKVEDAKWIYDNCGSNTKVEFYYSSDSGPLGKPEVAHISDMPEYLRGWDPTDPESDNPWNNFNDIAFNSYYYANKYSDLKAAFGYDTSKLKTHWYNYGIKEGRQASPAFDVAYYLANNSDLQEKYGNDYYAAYRYYVTGGYNETRKTAENFYVGIYKKYNEDLKDYSNYDAIMHYLNYGYNECRFANFSDEKLKLLFNSKYYADYNPDVKNVFGYDENALFNHWVEYGMQEGRQAIPTFDVKYYLANNADLQKTYGNDYYMMYKQYSNMGYYEYRKSSSEFNCEFYKNFYSDLNNMNSYTAIMHYCIYGKNEGRTGSLKNEEYIFDPVYYANKYPDLKANFGYNPMLLIKHFYKYGIKEGRQASLVFNAKYYLENNSDLTKAFGTDVKKAILHFNRNGIYEVRKTATTFDLTVYKQNYTDLQNTFKDNNFLYYKHYLNYGKNENRICI
jgi:hypothetical protein